MIPGPNRFSDFALIIYGITSQNEKRVLQLLLKVTTFLLVMFLKTCPISRHFHDSIYIYLKYLLYLHRVASFLLFFPSRIHLCVCVCVCVSNHSCLCHNHHSSHSFLTLNYTCLLSSFCSVFQCVQFEGPYVAYCETLAQSEWRKTHGANTGARATHATGTRKSTNLCILTSVC